MCGQNNGGIALANGTKDKDLLSTSYNNSTLVGEENPELHISREGGYWQYPLEQVSEKSLGEANQALFANMVAHSLIGGTWALCESFCGTEKCP